MHAGKNTRSSEQLARFRERLALPLIAAPMFLVSGVELVVAASRSGVIGSFPTVNCRDADELDHWLTTINEQLHRYDSEVGGHHAPICSNLIVHNTNTRRPRRQLQAPGYSASRPDQSG